MAKQHKLKEFKVYLTDEEIKVLEGIRIDCNTFEGSILAGIIDQIFGDYEGVE